MIKVVIFDCFGVIIADPLQLACDDLRERDPVAAEQVEDIIRAAGRGYINLQESAQQIADLFGWTIDEYYQNVPNSVVKDQKLLEYIASLRQTCRIALLSNIAKGNGILANHFTDKELNTYFDVVVTSGDVGFAKPEPQIYEITADRLNVRPDECLFTDDRGDYCTAARATGMQAIQYTSFYQFKTDFKQLLS